MSVRLCRWPAAFALPASLFVSHLCASAVPSGGKGTSVRLCSWPAARVPSSPAGGPFCGPSVRQSWASRFGAGSCVSTFLFVSHVRVLFPPGARARVSVFHSFSFGGERLGGARPGVRVSIHSLTVSVSHSVNRWDPTASLSTGF
jgi:hypothetical protein